MNASRQVNLKDALSCGLERDKQLSIQWVAEIYGVPHSTLQRALEGKWLPKAESVAIQQLLSPTEEMALKH
jgi:hypothetical protein